MDPAPDGVRDRYCAVMRAERALGRYAGESRLSRSRGDT